MSNLSTKVAPPIARRATLLAVTALSAACSTRTTNLVTSRGALHDGGTADAHAVPPGSDSQVATDAMQNLPVTETGITICGDHPCACANGKDDDSDGLTDGFDAECTGSFDDDETSFASGVHGEDRTSRCQDCYFDGNSGPGDDGCRRASSCATDGTPSSGSGVCATCAPTAECVDRCLPNTPNGCDCFGCCQVQATAGPVNVLLRDTCSLSLIEDAVRCPRCQPALDCANPCGRCELCPGKTLGDLPTDCSGAGGLDYTCDTGTACDPTMPCPNSAYCIQGCCTPVVI